MDEATATQGDRTAAADDRIVVYADYVCPFCRLGEATLGDYIDDRAERGLPPLAVEWRPFDLRRDERDPDGVIRSGPEAGKEEYVRSRWGEVESLAEEYGVEMTMDVEEYLRIDARNAQLASLGVQRDDPGRFRAFHGAVFDALWTETRDVGDPAVLGDLAADVGVDPDRVAEWIDDPELVERFDRATEAATDRGVRGVPTFVYGDRAVYGSRPPSAYRELVEGDG
jgi:predicted DsbA family dithiol-disulfide isomerase